MKLGFKTECIHFRIFPFFMKEGVDDEHSESDGVVVIYKFFPLSQPHRQFRAFHNYLPLVRLRSRGYSFFHKEGEYISAKFLHSQNIKKIPPKSREDARQGCSQINKVNDPTGVVRHRGTPPNHRWLNGVLIMWE